MKIKTRALYRNPNTSKILKVVKVKRSIEDYRKDECTVVNCDDSGAPVAGTKRTVKAGTIERHYSQLSQ